ncbi:MAG: hypothetical protein ACRD3F_15240, partial [Acidobacteriaceae bacterium]
LQDCAISPPPQAHMDHLLEQLCLACARLGEEGTRLENLAERFLGGVPGSPSNQATPAPASLVERLDAASGALHALIDRLGAARARPERL